MTGAQSLEGSNKSEEEISSRYTGTHPDIDAIQQNRGLLSFRSRKMLNLFHKKDSGGGQAVEKTISAPTSARDVKLEIIATPPQLAVFEAQKPEESKKKIHEAKKTVRTVVNRNGRSSERGHLKEWKTGKSPKVVISDGSPPRVVIDAPALTPLPKKKQLLPARLKLLETFYEGLEAAISLLAIRRQLCTFKSVCKTVEQMSKRRFLRTHLAQLKFLFPEVIEIDYVRVPDQDSRRDVWDLRIRLKSFSALPGGSPLKGASASPSRDQNAQTLKRRKEFHSRLLKFASSHNEDIDVPQHPLPQRLVGEQSLSSPSDPQSTNAGDMKQSIERNVEAAQPINEDNEDVAEIPNATETELSSASNTEEVYEFSIVGPGSVSLPDVDDITSHYPPSFKPHFQERGRELNSVEERPEPLESLDIGVTSHFAPFFKPRFQERQSELSPLSKSTSGTVPSEMHLQTSAISSRIITRFSKLTEESIQEDFSQLDKFEPAEVQESSLRPSAHVSERASSRPSTAELNMDTSSEGEKNAASRGESSAAGEEGDEALVHKASTVQPPMMNTPLDDGVLAFTPAKDATSSISSSILTPFSRRVVERALENPLSPQSVRCTTPAPSTTGGSAANSLPSTPYTAGINIHNSPAAAHTPASLSPSGHYHCADTEHLKKNEVSPEETVPAKSHGTMRSLMFGSPVRPPRPRPTPPPPQRQAEELAPSTPQFGTSLESTPRDESKYAPTFQSPVHTPHATTRSSESLGKSSYFSPVRPQRSRALRFSTPEKGRDDTEASAAKLGKGTSSSSEQQQFKSPQQPTGGSGMKPPRFLSPPKAQTLSAPATPAPPTPVRSILYSPPKRTKFTRGSLFSDDDEEKVEEQVQVSHILVPEARGKEEASTYIACETANLDFLTAKTRIREDETFITPAKASPSKTRKALNYVSEADLAIIHSLPAELIHSVREKERKIKDENTKELMLVKRRQQMMAGLPKMFNQLRMIFQSLKRSVLPRNELIKNVLSTNADITDRVEVEERLKLLIELAPDWITKQPSANGDYIYRINKSANVTKVQKKILEAC